MQQKLQSGPAASSSLLGQEISGKVPQLPLPAGIEKRLQPTDVRSSPSGRAKNERGILMEEL
jgi:hypothetical protein